MMNNVLKKIQTRNQKINKKKSSNTGICSSKKRNNFNKIYVEHKNFHIDLNTNKKQDLMEIVEEIIDLDSKMRFVAIIDLRGNIVEAIMKTGKTSLKTQKEEEHFCKQVALRRKMRYEFNRHLGKVRYVHVEREKVTQLVIYSKRKTIYFTVEPELSINKKLQLIMKVKKISSYL